MSITYTDPAAVTGVKTTATPRSGQTVSGHGGAIPTRHMVRYLGTWRRVYAMAYGNGATPYVKVHGAAVVLDITTQAKIQES